MKKVNIKLDVSIKPNKELKKCPILGKMAFKISSTAKSTQNIASDICSRDLRIPLVIKTMHPIELIRSTRRSAKDISYPFLATGIRQGKSRYEPYKR